MESPPLVKVLVPALIPFVFALLAAANAVDRGIGPVLVGLATTAIVLTILRAFEQADHRDLAELD